MPGKIELHLVLGPAHAKLLDKLMKKMGLDRTTVLKFALYELGVKHGLALDSIKED